MAVIRFELPVPSRTLSPNGRSHWSARSRSVRKARSDAMLVCRAEANRTGFTPGDGEIAVDLWCVPKTRRNRDTDNLLASCKAYLDGIADALYVNDSRFRPAAKFCEPGQPRLIVTVRA